MAQSSLPTAPIKLVFGSDNVLLSSSSSARKVIDTITADNNSNSLVKLYFFESKDLTSASGVQIAQLALYPGKTGFPPVLGQTINYSQSLICTSDAASDGDVVIKTTYSLLEQTE